MCGVIGAFSRPGRSVLDERGLAAALERMHRRGPDGVASWSEEGVTLGHRRLAILDLEARAAQPMVSPCGRFVIVFNGEIYNFRELRRALEREGQQFHTTSDTEVLLALFAREGEAMLPRLAGMFAFVIWDRVEQRAFAARDPYGIKPLYVATLDDGVLMASQVKALLATGRVPGAPCPEGMLRFWMLGSVPEPHTWYRAIRAVGAGQALWVREGVVTRQWTWHDIGAAWRTAAAAPLPGARLAPQVGEALRESVRRHLVADVPVGVFLSGGIDSGALAALMVESGARDLVGVTIAYDEYVGHAEDEAPMAARIARQYGIRHVVRKVGREEFLADVPRILDAMDQPSIDGVNTWYASKAVAEQGLKVVVSGVGGDELFQGYGHFREIPRLLALRGRLPWAAMLLRLAGRLQALRTGKQRWRHLEEWSRSAAGLWWLRRSVRAPEELRGLLDAGVLAQLPAHVDVEQLVREMAGEPAVLPALAVGQIESMGYLRNQLLRDSDWASMDHSVELRTPLVDARLLESLAPLLRGIGAQGGKRLLAEAPVGGLPPEVLQRPKTGFGIPLDKWLAGAPRPPSSPLAWQLQLARSFGGAA